MTIPLLESSAEECLPLGVLATRSSKMADFDYEASAELYPSRRYAKTARQQYRRQLPLPPYNS